MSKSNITKAFSFSIPANLLALVFASSACTMDTSWTAEQANDSKENDDAQTNEYNNELDELE